MFEETDLVLKYWVSFPQTFLTNPSKLRIYLRKINSYCDHRNSDPNTNPNCNFNSNSSHGCWRLLVHAGKLGCKRAWMQATEAKQETPWSRVTPILTNLNSNPDPNHWNEWNWNASSNRKFEAKLEVSPSLFTHAKSSQSVNHAINTRVLAPKHACLGVQIWLQGKDRQFIWR